MCLGNHAQGNSIKHNSTSCQSSVDTIYANTTDSGDRWSVGRRTPARKCFRTVSDCFRGWCKLNFKRKACFHQHICLSSTYVFTKFVYMWFSVRDQDRWFGERLHSVHPHNRLPHCLLRFSEFRVHRWPKSTDYCTSSGSSRWIMFPCLSRIQVVRLCKSVSVEAAFRKCDEDCKSLSDEQVQHSNYILRGGQWKVVGASRGFPAHMGYM